MRFGCAVAGISVTRAGHCAVDAEASRKRWQFMKGHNRYRFQSVLMVDCRLDHSASWDWTVKFLTIPPSPRNRHGRFPGERHPAALLETVVERCLSEGLVGSEKIAVDASLIAADANKQSSIPGEEWRAAYLGAGALRQRKGLCAIA